MHQESRCIRSEENQKLRSVMTITESPVSRFKCPEMRSSANKQKKLMTSDEAIRIGKPSGPTTRHDQISPLTYQANQRGGKEIERQVRDIQRETMLSKNGKSHMPTSIENLILMPEMRFPEVQQNYLNVAKTKPLII